MACSVQTSALFSTLRFKQFFSVKAGCQLVTAVRKSALFAVGWFPISVCLLLQSHPALLLPAETVPPQDLNQFLLQVCVTAAPALPARMSAFSDHKAAVRVMTVALPHLASRRLMRHVSHS